jgi:hypothetical protein
VGEGILQGIWAEKNLFEMMCVLVPGQLGTPLLDMHIVKKGMIPKTRISCLAKRRHSPFTPQIRPNAVQSMRFWHAYALIKLELCFLPEPSCAAV